MRNILTAIGSSIWYWLALVVLGVSSLGVALFYQYALEEAPCVLCIHVRIWVVGIIMVALLGMWLRRSRVGGTLAHTLMSILMFGLLERSWFLLGVERGTAEGSCNFDSGLPPWFALDQWWPSVFKVWAACGYTPVLAFGISMAESLVVMSGLLLVLSVALLYVRLTAKPLNLD